jgi:hypothetical protein
MTKNTASALQLTIYTFLLQKTEYCTTYGFTLLDVNNILISFFKYSYELPKCILFPSNTSENLIQGLNVTVSQKIKSWSDTSSLLDQITNTTHTHTHFPSLSLTSTHCKAHKSQGRNSQNFLGNL